MALVSPGIQVTVIDESFYTPAEPGTTPLIVVATAENKLNGAGTATAAGTLKANAGKAFRMTSQKDLVDTFGVPFFEKTPSASPIHGGERNEYGTLAAYSYLGVSNSAFIVRADVDLDQLEGRTAVPGSEPKDGTWWVDTRNTAWGIQEWNGAAGSTTGGQKFAAKTPIVLTDDDAAKIDSNTFAPLESVGSVGDYCVVALTVGNAVDADFSLFKENFKIYYKRDKKLLGGDAWVHVGSNDWKASHPTISSGTVSALTQGHSFTINGTTVTVPSGSTVSARLTNLVSTINGLSITGVTAKENGGRLFLFTDGANDGGFPGSPAGAPGDSSLSNAIVVGAGTGTAVGTSVSSAGDLGIIVGTYYGPELAQAPHTQVPLFKTFDATPRPTGSVWIKTTEPNNGARWRVKRWNSATQTWIPYSSPLYESGHAALYYLDRSGGGVNVPTDELFAQFNADEESGFDTSPATASFRMWRRANTERTTIKSSEITVGTLSAGSKTFTITESVKGELALSSPFSVTFTAAGTAADAQTIAAAINAAGFTHVEADVEVISSTPAVYQLVINHKVGGDFRLKDTSGTTLSSLFTGFNIDSGAGTLNCYTAPAASGVDFIASNWQPFASRDFFAQAGAPLDEPFDGQLWYNPAFSEVDIMIHNGTTWVGYRQATSPYWAAADADRTDPNGPIVSATQPETQSDGTVLKNGDLWISTADIENFPAIYRWNGLSLAWDLLDKTDQTTEDGVLFADARFGSSGATGHVAATIKDLLAVNYLDPDAPDPALYPKGMLLWNLRRSGGNVKKYNNNYINTAEDNPRMGNVSMAAYSTDRWTTASPNNEDGSGAFGRKAQRKVVVMAMKSVIDTSQEIRDEERRNFNIIAAPGYPEVLSNLINLNIDRGVTAFVVGDTPLRLKSNATELINWGTNARLVTDNGDDGIVSYDEYCAVYYPNGFTTDLGGANAVVPASHMMLKTIALSDQVSYPWFAPAGTRRGGITNATAVGYIDAATGEFQTVALNEGTRDVLYDLKVNPIPFFVGVGLVAYGQKTRARNASALDRINVARLIVYLRSQLNKLARPYVFEPNDKITRDEIKGAVESLLLELVGLRALYDFAVVCDESNNTPSRIDRNELWVDIAIEPVKAVEFIYIPLRVKNTGEI